MTVHRVRWVRYGLALLLVAGLLAVGSLIGARLAVAATGYEAKMLCSEVFVAGRQPNDVLSELPVDDVKVLRVISGRVDRHAAMAAATVFGLVERRAYFRDGAGCTVIGASQAAAIRPPHPQPLRDRSVPPRTADAAIDQGRPPAGTRLDAVVDGAFSEPTPSRPRRTRAIVVIYDGRIVAERYAPGFGMQTPLLGWSMAKTVMNALIGVLVRQGRLSLEMEAPIPAWRSHGDPRARITIDHLLHMSSGLQFDEDMTSPLAGVMHMLFCEPDMAAYAADKRLETAPGTRWQYSSGTTVILARIVRSVVGDREYPDFPRASLFAPLGMTGAMLEADASGTFVGSSFMYATARDWARLGMLYLQDGVWNGKRILPEGWVKYTRTPAAADPSRAYGAHVWLAVPEEYNRSRRSLPSDAFHAAGHEAQFVTIVPSHRTVIVRLGKTRYADAWDQGAFVADVLSALAELDRPAEWDASTTHRAPSSH